MHADLPDRLKLLEKSDEGYLDRLECPACHRPSVSVAFSHPGSNEYRTWFTCHECSFSMRVQNTGKPPHYSEDRIDVDRQAYDIELLRRCIFDRA